jgi:hypothetical protein
MPPILLRPSYPKRPAHRRIGELTPGSLDIGDGTITNTSGFLAITCALLWEPTDGFTATGFRIAVAGSGSKAIGVLERRNQSLRLSGRASFCAAAPPIVRRGDEEADGTDA